MNKFCLNLDSGLASNWIPIDYESFKFAAGESHIKIRGDYVSLNSEDTNILIQNRINNAEDIIATLLATDALKRIAPKAERELFIPYVPYGRQDRPMVTGEPFSLKVFADLINSQKYNKVYTLEPHSDVTAALIDNLETITPYYLLSGRDSIKREFGDFTLTSPDGGALKRIYKHASFMGYEGDILCATKIRDLSTGKILRTTVDATDEQIKDKTIVIDDDICSYGGTFVALAKVLKVRGAKNVVLMTAHYEDVADEEKLKEYIDAVYTTNSISNKTSEFVRKRTL